jgi:hypothetical protein
MKNSIFSLLLLVSILLLSACDNNSENPAAELEGDVTLTFKADFKGQPLLMYDDTYDYEAGMSLRFQLFQFYISHLSLISEMADSINGGQELIDIALVSFKDITSQQLAEEGIVLKIEDVPAGLYKGIKLGVGVSDDFNMTQPGDYAAGHPLSDNYWTAATGYIFSKIEGNADLNQNGDYSEKLTFHTGASELYNEKVFIQDVEVKQGSSLNLEFKVDLYRVLAQNTNEFLDFRQVTQDHTNDMNVAGFIANNLANALSLE